MDQWYKLNGLSAEGKKLYAKIIGIVILILIVITFITLIIRMTLPDNTILTKETEPYLIGALFIEIIALLLSAVVLYGDGNFFSSSITQTLIAGIIVITVVLLWLYEYLGGLESLIITTIAVALRMFWYLYEKFKDIGSNQKLGITTVLFILGLNAFFQLMNIVFGAEIYRGLAIGYIEEIYWSLRFAIAPLMIYPILYYFDHKKDIAEEVEALNQRNSWYIFNFLGSFFFIVAYIIFELLIFPYILEYDAVTFGGVVSGLIYEGQVNYFSYVFFVLLQSPAPALMIGFMVFGAVAVMISQNLSGVGKVIGGFATGVVVIIPMLFIFSIFSGGIKAPDLLVEILGSGIAQFVFGLAETSAFILMLSIIAVFISAGRLLGQISTGD